MKILVYLLLRITKFIYGDNWIRHRVQGLWVLLALLDVYILIFVIIPVDNILGGHYLRLAAEERGYMWLYVISIVLLEGYYLFWDDRYDKIYKHVSSLPANQRKRQLYILVGVFTILSATSIWYLSTNDIG